MMLASYYFFLLLLTTTRTWKFNICFFPLYELLHVMNPIIIIITCHIASPPPPFPHLSSTPSKLVLLPKHSSTHSPSFFSRREPQAHWLCPILCSCPTNVPQIRGQAKQKFSLTRRFWPPSSQNLDPKEFCVVVERR